MFNSSIFALFTVFAVVLIDAVSAQCTIPLKLAEPTPVFILSVGNTHKLFRPNAADTVISAQTELTLACTGAGNALTALQVQTAKFQCNNGKWQYNNQNAANLNTYKCTRIPESQLVNRNERCAGNVGSVWSVGFDAGAGGYAESFRLCHDGGNKAGIYSYHVINGAIGRVSTTGLRNFCNDETFLPVNVKYNVKLIQEATMKRLLGATQQYLKNDATYYFAVGHHASCADFTYGYEQIATNYLVNAAPQYQGFNGGNWLFIEERIRRKARSLGTDVEVYTGSLDVLQLPSQSGANVAIYLDTTQAGVQPVKVPKYFFKVVKNGAEAIAFVGLNNIVPPEIAPNLANFCTSLCTSEPRFNDAKKGKVVCCDLNDFMRNPLVQVVLPPLSATSVMGGLY